MSYVERNLGKDETIVITAKKNWLYLLPAILQVIVFLVIAIAIHVVVPDALEDAEDMGNYLIYVGWALFALAGVLPFVISLLKLLSLELVLTNKRLVGKEGILRIHALDVHVDKLDSVSVSAGFWGRIFRYYTLTVVSIGGAGADTRPSRKGDKGNNFFGISNAQEFKNAVTEAIELHAAEARRQQAEEIARAMGRTTDK